VQLDRSPHGVDEPLVVEVELGRLGRGQSVERRLCGVRPDVVSVSATGPRTGGSKARIAATPSPNSSGVTPEITERGTSARAMSSAAAATTEVGTVLELASTTTPVRRSGTSTSFDPNPGSAPLWLSVRRPR